MDKRGNLHNEEDTLISKMIDADQTVAPSEKEQYKKMIGGGVILVDPTGTGDYTYLSRKDVDDMLQLHWVSADRTVWVHPAHKGKSKTTLKKLKKKFKDVTDENGDLIEFSAEGRMSRILIDTFKINPPAQDSTQKTDKKPKRGVTKKEEATSDNPLIKQIHEDFEKGVIDEVERDYLVSMAEVGDLAYVNLNGSNQYLSTAYIDYLIENGTQSDLELEIVLSADGLNDGKKTTLEDLKDVFERPDAAATVTDAKQDQPTEQPQEAQQQDPEQGNAAVLGIELEGIPSEEPPLSPEQLANLTNLAEALPKVSQFLPDQHLDGATLESKLKIEHEGGDHAAEQVQSSGEGLAQMPTERPAAPSGGGQGSPSSSSGGGGGGGGLPQTGGPTPEPPKQDKGGTEDQVEAAKEAQKKEKDLVNQASEESEEEEEEEQTPNRYQQTKPGGKKKGSLLKKVAIAGAVGSIFGPGFSIGAGIFSTPEEAAALLISIFV